MSKMEEDRDDVEEGQKGESDADGGVPSFFVPQISRSRQGGSTHDTVDSKATSDTEHRDPDGQEGSYEKDGCEKVRDYDDEQDVSVVREPRQDETERQEDSDVALVVGPVRVEQEATDVDGWVKDVDDSMTFRVVLHPACVQPSCEYREADDGDGQVPDSVGQPFVHSHPALQRPTETRGF